MIRHRMATAALVACALAAPAMAEPQSDRARERRNERAADRADDRQDDRARDAQDDRGRGPGGRFRGLDADNDGVITRGEWRGSDESFRQQDGNRDGVLSGAEVDTVNGLRDAARRRDDLIADFTRADRDNDRRLRRGEWEARFGAFEESDANRDGLVTRAEFIAARRADLRDGTAPRSRTPAGDPRDSRAWRAGFEKGLVEGRGAGREDRQVNGGRWDLEGQRELESADAGYEPVFGTREDYQAGYRAGFRLGYTEAFGPR